MTRSIADPHNDYASVSWAPSEEVYTGPAGECAGGGTCCRGRSGGRLPRRVGGVGDEEFAFVAEAQVGMTHWVLEDYL
jgi:hypothetical protein